MDSGVSSMRGYKALAITIALVLTMTVVICVVANENEPTDEELLMDALVFTYPMALVEKTMQTQSNTVFPDYDEGRAPINQFIHTQHLADASFRDFSMPNVDTIYSYLNFDVSEEPYVLTIPDPDRFFNTQVLNAWIDVIAVYGDAGKKCDTIVICSRNCDIDFPEGMEIVRSDTDRGILGSRTYIQDKDDMHNVIDIQNGMQFIPWTYYESKEPFTPPQGEYDPDDDFVPRDEVWKMDLQEYFDFVNSKMLVNHPYPADADMLKRLAKINVGPGLKFDESVLGPQARVMWQTVKTGMYEHTLEASEQFTIQDAIWQYHWDPIAHFGTEYEYRAFIAYTGYVANPISVALYITTKTDSHGSPIISSHSYNVHFEAGQFPPKIDRGFWSLTVYGADYFLIDNEIDRYSVNDRMTFDPNEDGSVDILLSFDRPDDISNWLPIEGDSLLLTIRIYVPDLDAIDNGWKCPTILPVEQIL